MPSPSLCTTRNKFIDSFNHLLNITIVFTLQRMSY